MIEDINNTALILSISEEIRKGNRKPLTDYIIDACYTSQQQIINYVMSMFYVFIAMLIIKFIRRILIKKFNFIWKINIPYNIPIILKSGEFDILNELIDLGNIYIYAIILNIGLFIILR